MGTYKQLFTRRRVLVRCSRFVLYHRYVLSRKYILFWRNSSVRGERMAPISVALQRSSVVLFSLPLPPPLSLSFRAGSFPPRQPSFWHLFDRSFRRTLPRVVPIGRSSISRVGFRVSNDDTPTHSSREINGCNKTGGKTKEATCRSIDKEKPSASYDIHTYVCISGRL